MHSNIKYLCGRGVVAMAWAGFQFVGSISGLKSERKVSLKLIDND